MKSTVSATCDAEIGKPGNFHICGRKAKWEILSATGATLDYCQTHKEARERAWLEGRIMEFFQPAAFAEFREIKA